MAFGNYTTATDSAPQVEREALWSETGSHAKRLAEINLQLDNLITRLAGPRPSQVSANEVAKQPMEPHLRELSRRIGQELYSLEHRVGELQSLIG